MANPSRTLSADARDVSSELLITAGGIVTSLAIVIANAVITHTIGFNFLSLSFWFVIPAGAIIGGMGAASGYYVAAIWTHTMPSRRFLFEMLAIGASTWLLAQWLEYASLRFDDGTSVSSVVGFWDYFRIHAEHEQLTIRTRYGANVGSTGELGKLGYAREALQLIGYVLGGFAVWAILSERERCDGCRKYAKIKKLLTGVDPERFQVVMDSADLSFPGMVDSAKVAMRNRPFLGLDLVLLACPRCHREWARPAVVVATGKDSSERARLGAYTVTSQQSAKLRQAASLSPVKGDPSPAA